MAQLLVLPIVVIWFFIVARKAGKNAILWAIGGGAIYFGVSSIVAGAGLSLFFMLGDSGSDSAVVTWVVIVTAFAILMSIVCLVWVKNRYIEGGDEAVDEDDFSTDEDPSYVTCTTCSAELELTGEEIDAGFYVCPDCNTRTELPSKM